MPPISYTGTSLCNWTETTLSFSPSSGAELHESQIEKYIPRLIMCEKTDNLQVKHIRLVISEATEEVAPEDLARIAIGLLSSSGICDTQRPTSVINDGVLPVGEQPNPFSEETTVLVVTEQTKKVLLRTTVGRLGFKVGPKNPIQWRRAANIAPKYSHTFISQIPYQQANTPGKLVLTRLGYAADAGCIFQAEPITKFKLSLAKPHAKPPPTLPQIWLIRSQPKPGYFIKWNKLQTAQLFSGHRDQQTNTSPNVVNQLQNLLKWLSIEDAGRVLRALIKINKAKISWAKQHKESDTLEVSWHDIEGFFKCTRKELPHPKSGKYILGSNLSIAPKYIPNNSEQSVRLEAHK